MREEGSTVSRFDVVFASPVIGCGVPLAGVVAAEGAQDGQPRVPLDLLPLARDLQEELEAERPPVVYICIGSVCCVILMRQAAQFVSCHVCLRVVRSKTHRLFSRWRWRRETISSPRARRRWRRYWLGSSKRWGARVELGDGRQCA